MALVWSCFHTHGCCNDQDMRFNRVLSVPPIPYRACHSVKVRLCDLFKHLRAALMHVQHTRHIMWSLCPRRMSRKYGLECRGSWSVCLMAVWIFSQGFSGGGFISHPNSTWASGAAAMTHFLNRWVTGKKATFLMYWIAFLTRSSSLQLTWRSCRPLK